MTDSTSAAPDTGSSASSAATPGSASGARSAASRVQRLAERAIGRLNRDDETTVEARAKPRLELADLGRRPVTREHHLLPRAVQRVEQVEQLVLRPLLPGERMHVVDDQRARRAVARPPPSTVPS